MASASLMMATTAATSTFIPSPTYDCALPAAPLMDVVGSYCVIPGGHARMELCCDAGGVHFRPDCHSWCGIPEEQQQQQYLLAGRSGGPSSGIGGDGEDIGNSSRLWAPNNLTIAATAAAAAPVKRDDGVRDWLDTANGFFDCLQADGGARPSWAVCQPDVKRVAVNSEAPVTYAPYGVWEATSTSSGGAARETGRALRDLLRRKGDGDGVNAAGVAAVVVAVVAVVNVAGTAAA